VTRTSKYERREILAQLSARDRSILLGLAAHRSWEGRPWGLPFAGVGRTQERPVWPSTISTVSRVRLNGPRPKGYRWPPFRFRVSFGTKTDAKSRRPEPKSKLETV
jgi:hypothetical protein